jgi:hypothetical protein
MGRRSCSAIARWATGTAPATSPQPANTMARQRAPVASIQARSSLRPLRSSAATSGSAASDRPRPTRASTASGTNDATMISVASGAALSFAILGCNAFTAAS